MASSYLDALTKPDPVPSRREKTLKLAMMLLSILMQEDDTPEGAAPIKDGTGPEIYVAPRYSPSP